MNGQINARFQLGYTGFDLAVDLTLPGSGITVLFGPSGSGKTTLLRCIAGLQHADRGYLNVNGVVWQDGEQGVYVPTYRRSLGYVFQEANLFTHLSVYENLIFGLKRVGRSPGHAELQPTIDLLGIGPLLQRMPDRLSGGERQRVAIARALALKPDLLLMDEPLAALDFRLKQEIMPYLLCLHRQLSIPILYVTHSQQEVAQLADHLVILEQGRCVMSGPLADTLSRIDLPMAQSKQAVMVWHAEIAEHEPDYHLTRVTCGGIELVVPAIDAATGDPVRVQIHARDVSIALEAPKATSILNVLPARVTGIADDPGGQSVLRLWVGGQPLLAHITQKSKQLLKLQTGMPVYVQIKGTSILN